MGRPFAEELAALPGTYAWALAHPIDNLVRVARGLAGLPLVAAGSGGSFTAAHLACEIHRHFTRGLSIPLTPLQAVGSTSQPRDLGVLLPTAGGKNPDVIGAFRHFARAEPRRLVVWCGTRGSKLAQAAGRFPFADVEEVDLPAGKDGFLAVNSLLAFGVLLARAYAAACGQAPRLPARFDDLVGIGPGGEWPGAHAEGTDRLWERQTLIVLHGPETQPGAVDLESKFTEAALGSVQVADFRHFAHGRHHWLAKRRRESAVLALTTPSDRHTADQTLALLPRDTPVLRIDVEHGGWLAGLAAMVRGFAVVQSAGRARGFDPGDPGVPAFGRSLYRLNVYPAAPAVRADVVPTREAAAIERKAGESVEALAAAGRLDGWRGAHAAFVARLSAARFAAVVFDYDGTLCDEAERYGPLPVDTAAEVIRLLRAGCVVGVATGRGRSVRDSLRGAIPEELWGRVVVGYYNGGDLGRLGDESCPDGRKEAGVELRPFADLLDRHALLFPGVTRDDRPRQITLTPPEGASPRRLWEAAAELVRSLSGSGLAALRSGHSVDVVAPGVSKTAVIAAVRDLVGAGADVPVLCIGDRGRWPGNDYALLGEPHALSVDEVSADPTTGWNLAPPGHRGRQATVGYLRLMRKAGGGFRLTADRLGGGR